MLHSLILHYTIICCSVVTAIFIYDSTSLVSKSQWYYAIYHCFCIFVQQSYGYRYTSPVITNTWQNSASLTQQSSRRTSLLMAIVCHYLAFVTQFRLPTVLRVSDQSLIVGGHCSGLSTPAQVCCSQCLLRCPINRQSQPNDRRRARCTATSWLWHHHWRVNTGIITNDDATRCICSPANYQPTVSVYSSSLLPVTDIWRQRHRFLMVTTRHAALLCCNVPSVQ